MNISKHNLIQIQDLQKEIEEKEKQLFDALYEGMKRINGITFYCDYDTCAHTPIIAFNLAD